MKDTVAINIVDGIMAIALGVEVKRKADGERERERGKESGD